MSVVRDVLEAQIGVIVTRMEYPVRTSVQVSIGTKARSSDVRHVAPERRCFRKRQGCVSSVGASDTLKIRTLPGSICDHLYV